MKRKLGHLLSRPPDRPGRWMAAALAEAGLAGLSPSHGDVLARLFGRGVATMRELAAFDATAAIFLALLAFRCMDSFWSHP